MGATAAVDGDKHAKAHYDSIKKIIEDAQSEINDKLVGVLAKRAMIEKSIAESMGDTAAAGSSAGLENGGDPPFEPPADEHDGCDPEDWV